MWSVVEKTALAEAELEYKDKVSDAIFVKFPVKKTNIKELNDSFAVIWTTTPWTIPANKALAYSEEIEYTIIIANDEKYIIAQDLVESFTKEVKIDLYTVLRNVRGVDLRGTICEHPLKSLGFVGDSPLLPADFVSSDSGTGLVHIAPAHGLDDFLLGKKYNLEVLDIVNDDGILIDSLPHFGGEHVFKVNDKIIKSLEDAYRLVYNYKITHSYPHSWRSKAPLIFRTTAQWFISIEKIRETLLKEIDKTEWFPSGYVNRIRSMVEQRPDWCISRQRVWGVPIALFLDKRTGGILMDDAVFETIIKTFSEEGIESWHQRPVSFFLKEKYNADDFEKVTDTLEVWFDSACSSHYVLEKRDELSWPANMYFEGSDQHRGWFQSSLVVSCCLRGQAPYRQVATNGFVLDKNGKKMSKSQGNVISPGDIITRSGADILRLWCINSDYSEDLRIGAEILRQQEDVYRRFRNILRYLLGVISDFSIKEKIEYANLPELEKFILHHLVEIQNLLEKSIECYDFHAFYTVLHAFCVNMLSAFYFDIRKDCVYCDSKTSFGRRACRTVMNEIFLKLVHWLAPVLSFTAEEAWQAYSLNTNKTSIHLNQFGSIPEEWFNLELNNKWMEIKNVRKAITEALEIERSAKTIGSSLEAEIFIYSEKRDIVEMLKQVDVAEIAIVSKATVIAARAPSNAVFSEELEDVGIVVRISSATKCQRCWKFLADVSSVKTRNYDRVDLCRRCAAVVSEL
jgi:isoleucyl-tRNA synthetase